MLPRRRVVILCVMLLGFTLVALIRSSPTAAPPGWMPGCVFRLLTGIWCPGCGGTRAVFFACHGHLLAALQANALVLIVLPTLGVYVTLRLWTGRSLDLVPPSRLHWIGWILVTMIVLFTVLRNIPALTWLRPAG